MSIGQELMSRNDAYDFNIVSRSLTSTSKDGVIPKNPDGTYTVCVGSLDQVSVQDKLFYSSDGAEKFFGSQAAFLETLNGNYMFGELGHPKPQPGQSPTAFFNRNMWCDEDRISHQILAVRMIRDFTDPSTGEKVVALMADIKPAGKYGPQLEKDLNTPGVNVSFSIRCLTKPKLINGRMVRVLIKIITFDAVTRPGMPVAHKMNSLTCQSAFNPYAQSTDVGLVNFTDDMVENAIKEMEEYKARGLSLQSYTGFNILKELQAENVIHDALKKENIKKSYTW